MLLPAPARLAVLCVDDDRDVCEALVDVVEGSGRRAFAARDGSDALRMLERGEVPGPCTILLDWIMAPMNGQEFLARLQVRPDAADFPVLVMTGQDSVAENLGPLVVGVLSKPFDLDVLLTTLDRSARLYFGRG